MFLVTLFWALDPVAIGMGIHGMPGLLDSLSRADSAKICVLGQRKGLLSSLHIQSVTLILQALWLWGVQPGRWHGA